MRRSEQKVSKHTLSLKQKKIISIASVVIYILLSVVLLWFVGRPLIRFVDEPAVFRQWVSEHGLWGRLAFIGMVVLQVVVAIIPGEPFEIGAGYAFGMWEGTLLCMIGVIIGSAITFAIVRCFGIKIVEVFFSREKIDRLRLLQNHRRFNTIIFILSFIPGTPKDLLSYFIGLTDMKLRTWLLIVAVSRIPSIVTSTVGGNALGTQNYVFAIVVFASTAVIAGVGLFIYNHISRADKEKKADEEDSGS